MSNTTPFNSGTSDFSWGPRGANRLGEFAITDIIDERDRSVASRFMNMKVLSDVEVEEEVEYCLL